MIFETDIGRVQIREAEVADASRIIRFMNWVTGEVDFHTYGANDFHISIEDEKRVLEVFHARENCLFLIAEFKGELIAAATLSGGIKERVAHRGNVGITVAKRYWRLGIGKQMMKVMIDYARKSNVLTKLELLVHENNMPAIHLYTQLGFFQEGVLTRYFRINERYYDGIRMGIYVE